MQKANITRQPTNNVTVLINNIEKAFQLLRVSKGGGTHSPTIVREKSTADASQELGNCEFRCEKILLGDSY
jgi:hypothetical protein